MDSLERLIHSPSYKQSNFSFSSSDGMSTLLKFTENAVSNSPGNNDGVENIGDAYTNMAVLIVIKEYLDSIQYEKQYSADELYGRAIFLHSRLISNNILGRIHYKSGYDDPEKLCIDSATRVALRDWIAANHEHAPPKALADLFEANAWLIVQVYQFPALCSHMKALLLPLLPTALSMYEVAYGTQRQCPSDYFISQVQHWRKRDARKVDEEHVTLLITELANIASNRPFCAAVEHLWSALEQGPFIRFDRSGNIEGTHQRLQLLGYNLLRYYIAVDIDRSLPLTRSVVKGAAKFQSILANLAASDQCLEYLVRTFGPDGIYDTHQSLLPRSAAEIFVAAIAMAYEGDKVPGTPELLPSAMWCIAGQLVRRASIALSKATDNKIIPVPSVPTNPLDINTFPRELELPRVEVHPAGKEAQTQVQGGSPNTRRVGKKRRIDDGRNLDSETTSEETKFPHSFTFTYPR